MNTQRSMTGGKPLGLLVTFALPLMFGNIFQQLYTVVDTAIVGRGVGMHALAALGTVDWLNWMLLGIAQGFTQGFAVRIAQRFGASDEAGVKRNIGQAARLCIFIALGCTALAQLGLPVFLHLLRVPQDIRPMATLYTRVLMAGLPAVTFYNYCASVLRAVGDSKTPLYAMIAAAITNIILDCIAVFILDWGIAGAAGATVFAQLLSGAVCALKIWKTPLLHFGKTDICRDSVHSADLLRLGAPVAGKNIVIALGGMTIQSIVNGFDMSFIAGFTATNKLYGLLEIAALSYGYAVTTYVGQNFGAGKPDRIKSGMRSAVLLSVITALVIAAIMFLFGRPITMLFISREDPLLAAAAGDTAYLYLRFMAVSLPALYLLYAYQSALQGIGNTLIPMVSGMIEFCLRVGLALLVGATGFQTGIFGAEVSAWFGAAVFLGLHYFRALRRIGDTH